MHKVNPHVHNCALVNGTVGEAVQNYSIIVELKSFFSQVGNLNESFVIRKGVTWVLYELGTGQGCHSVCCCT